MKKIKDFLKKVPTVVLWIIVIFIALILLAVSNYMTQVDKDGVRSKGWLDNFWLTRTFILPITDWMTSLVKSDYNKSSQPNTSGDVINSYREY
jgi:hypothetical protein